MRQVTMYAKSFPEVYSSCVERVLDLAKRKKFNDVSHILEAESLNYELMARNSDLYLLPAVKSKLGDVVRGELSRKDLKDLYELNFVGQRQAPKDHYDRILLSPLYKKCPYCSLGQATTLDHYLPKSRFPQFSVSVANLVPSCKDCQSKKGRDYATNKVTQTLHPYFDSAAFFNDSWLKARLLRAPSVHTEFYVDPPAMWPASMKDRVRAHFSAHNLAARFAIEASSELISVNQSVADLRVSGYFSDIKQMLRRQAKGYAGNCMNSWQSAFYEALASDVWYCTAPVV